VFHFHFEHFPLVYPYLFSTNPNHMKKSRLEAFSDGVLAIIITIMVLEMKIPHGTAWSDLEPILPVFGSYVLSFIYLAIYWNNHHHMFQVVEKVNGAVLWANMALLLCLSLIPFTTAWMGENHFHGNPVALYGMVLLLAGFSYFLLTLALKRIHHDESHFARATADQRKEMVSTILYIIAVVCAFFVEWASIVIYILVAIMWVIPDKRMERILLDNK